MFKPTKLLKVVSIIIIVLSILSVLVLFAGDAMIGQIKDMEIPGVDMDMLYAAYSPLSIGIAVASSAVMMAAGILGVRGKAFKAALVLMSVYTVYCVVSLVQSAGLTGITPLSFVSFILPVLYFWGLYQSKE